MNLADFLVTVDATRMTQRTKDATRLVLVDGLRVVNAAKQMNMKRQQLEDAVARVEATYKKLKGFPSDWVCVTLCVPTDQVNALRELERQCLRQAGLTVD